MSVGMLGHLGLKQEAAYGVEATPPTVFGEFKSESANFDNQLIIPRYVGGVRGNKRILPGPFTNDGSFDLDLTPEDLIGWLLKGLFGQVATTALGGGAYSHVFSELQSSTLPSYTMQIERVAGCFNYTGMRIASMDVGVKPNDLLGASFNWSAQNVKESVAANPAYTILDPFSAYDVGVVLNGVSNVDFEDLKFTISNESEDVYTLNTERFKGKNVAKRFDTNGSFGLEFGDMNLVRRIWGNSLSTEPENCLTSGTLTLNIISTCQKIAASGVFYSLAFTWHELYFAKGQPQISGPDDRIMQSISWETKHNAVQNKMITCTLVNSQSGYPNP